MAEFPHWLLAQKEAEISFFYTLQQYLTEESRMRISAGCYSFPCLACLNLIPFPQDHLLTDRYKSILKYKLKWKIKGGGVNVVLRLKTNF